MPHTPLIIAHRGASHEAPENTLAAFRLAWAQGADGIECDVHLTRDRRIVCIHDANTRRTTGVNRRVASLTWAALRRLDAGAWKAPRWRGERIPLLREVLEALPRGKRIQIEVKAGPDLVPRLVPLVRAVPDFRRRVTVITFDTRVIRALKRAAPEVPVLWLTAYRQDPHRAGWRPTRATVLATLAATHADGLGSQSHRALNAALARDLRTRGRRLCVWTVDDAVTARRFARLGVEAIATNRPGWLRPRMTPTTA
ncbi:MAG: glycerophosphodiester phosphodiesterase [Lentisphaerae bacterium]|nr:glycerophosphodiester phosphodiesterase [Lentisphaerota bacterium]